MINIWFVIFLLVWGIGFGIIIGMFCEYNFGGW